MSYIPYSCPDFDEAIEHIEAARTINRQLRDARDELEEELKEAQLEIKELTKQIDELQDELNAMKELTP